MRRPLAALAVVVAALALGACGQTGEPIREGHNEGSYLDLGELKYQVQISRILNPQSVEDRAYLVGVDPAERSLRPGEQWFGVFMRVENGSGRVHDAADEYMIVDTQETEFEPLELAPENVFAYRGGNVPANGVLPRPDSPAEQGSIQGSLLLFKIPNANLENRPLELVIRHPEQPSQVATVDLDV